MAACARIFFFRWGHLKYIPVLLSRHFIESAIGHPSYLLTESFLKYISTDESQLLKKP